MRLRALTPWSCVPTGSNPSIFSLHRELDKMFDDFLGSSAPQSQTVRHWQPRLNIAETEQAYLISAELPGVEEKDITLELHDGLLSLSGKREQKTESKGHNFHRIESFYGEFSRQIQLPDTVETDKVEAKFKNGILDITVPKMAEIKPSAKKIAIKTA